MGKSVQRAKRAQCKRAEDLSLHVKSWAWSFTLLKTQPWGPCRDRWISGAL